MQNRPAEPAPQRNGSNASKSTLGSDLKIVGDVTSSGSIEVMGEVEGTITARGLMVGPEGRASGTFSADSVEVRGRLEGRLSCSSLVVRAAAQVISDVTYRTVVIENGATVDGRFKLIRD
ncbi:polymer-forming cytoskeletal protein [Cereibacter sphaeroides]|uniref:bactofilin family protein n=1 Tax=Rhodobacterales TaxID=204455 RepID=UPI000BBEA91C|nr:MULTISPECIES: polymer-forming cytoskeletal protein [Paracoccaceae]MCE6949591.1 polymer-forming cytoskeletal protein [Cereibacter sphaeroides]MCE6957593.1 polymer-forming cytoskeletal protein [Cereibacter sphaeroides]MCE6967213.1 polymer-forming cytoskeletal protein [Cereibacter sphaeroides]MCE6971378.1 polymer-forming cytoskeletal protein [Cereibacter sphaeroides]